MNNKGKHACVPDAYTQKWCMRVACALVAYLSTALYLCFSFMHNLNYCGGFHVHLIILSHILWLRLTLFHYVWALMIVRVKISRFLPNYVLLLQEILVYLLFIVQVILTPFHCVCRSSILTVKLLRWVKWEICLLFLAPSFGRDK